jgi:hypothetical protein
VTHTNWHPIHQAHRYNRDCWKVPSRPERLHCGGTNPGKGIWCLCRSMFVLLLTFFHFSIAIVAIAFIATWVD